MNADTDNYNVHDNGYDDVDIKLDNNEGYGRHESPGITMKEDG
jgi:hypothetical protein